MSAHPDQLVDLVQALPGRTRFGAEIGVAEGTTSAELLRRLPELRLLMVDSWATYPTGHPYHASGDRAARRTTAQQAQSKASAEAATMFAADRRRIIAEESTTAARQLESNSLDFAFIDADHTYDGVRADLDAWYRVIRPGGLLCGHDYGHRRDRRGVWGVQRAVDQFADQHGLKVGLGHSTIWWLFKPLPKIAETAAVDPTSDASEMPVKELMTEKHGTDWQETTNRLLVDIREQRSIPDSWRAPDDLFASTPRVDAKGAVTVAIITPTLGRPTLQRTIDSAIEQLGPHDEWWIVGDGPQPGVRDIVSRTQDQRVRYLECRSEHSTYGNAQRNLAMQQATADYFLFLDDDDLLLPGALDAVRRRGTDYVPLMFKMDYRPKGVVLWTAPVIRKGNVGGAMFVVPRIPGRWCLWHEATNAKLGDLHFIQQTLALWPDDALRWCDDVIYLCMKHGKGR